jgi:hypothetical protein
MCVLYCKCLGSKYFGGSLVSDLFVLSPTLLQDKHGTFEKELTRLHKQTGTLATFVPCNGMCSTYSVRIAL